MLVLTRSYNVKCRLTAMWMGAINYLGKPIHPADLRTNHSSPYCSDGVQITSGPDLRNSVPWKQAQLAEYRYTNNYQK